MEIANTLLAPNAGFDKKYWIGILQQY